MRIIWCCPPPGELDFEVAERRFLAGMGDAGEEGTGVTGTEEAYVSWGRALAVEEGHDLFSFAEDGFAFAEEAED